MKGVTPAVLTSALMLLAAPASAQPPAAPAPAAPAEDHGRHQPPPLDAAARSAKARAYFTDVVLINHHGEPMRLFSDLLAGKTVVISPFFTTCTGVCPLLQQKLAAVQTELGERLGRDVHLISISVDPETDTPEKLAAYAERFKARPGWYFLTGDKPDVDQALYKLGQYVEDKEAHTNILIVGNEAAGRWQKVLGLGPTEALLQAVEDVLADDG